MPKIYFALTTPIEFIFIRTVCIGSAGHKIHGNVEQLNYIIFLLSFDGCSCVDGFFPRWNTGSRLTNISRFGFSLFCWGEIALLPKTSLTFGAAAWIASCTSPNAILEGSSRSNNWLFVFYMDGTFRLSLVIINLHYYCNFIIKY